MKYLRMCLNWKVLAGLAGVGVGMWLVAPGLVAAVFPVLLALACPLSMLLMMRGMQSGRTAHEPTTQEARGDAGPDDLRARLDEIRSEERVLSGKLGRLEGGSGTEDGDRRPAS